MIHEACAIFYFQIVRGTQWAWGKDAINVTVINKGVQRIIYSYRTRELNVTILTKTNRPFLKNNLDNSTTLKHWTKTEMGFLSMLKDNSDHMPPTWMSRG